MKLLIIVLACVTRSQGIDISCSLTGRDGQVYPGERCITDCVDGSRNYCIYPQGVPEEFDEWTKSHMPTTCDCVNSQTINYDAVVPCDRAGPGTSGGMMCDRECLAGYGWCNDNFVMRCPDSGVMTNDPFLCSQDERWSDLTCDMPGHGRRFPGKRCRGCKTGRTSNYCYYPQGFPEDEDERKMKSIFRTSCDCVSSACSTVSVVILVIVMIAAVGYI